MLPWFWYSRGGMLMVASSTFSASLEPAAVVLGSSTVVLPNLGIAKR